MIFSPFFLFRDMCSCHNKVHFYLFAYMIVLTCKMTVIQAASSFHFPHFCSQIEHIKISKTYEFQMQLELHSDPVVYVRVFNGG